MYTRKYNILNEKSLNKSEQTKRGRDKHCGHQEQYRERENIIPVGSGATNVTE